MFLVAGLAVAGVAGILAVFYLSVRSGKRGGKRLRPAAQGRIGADRAGAGRPGAVRRPGGRAASVRTGGQTEFALRASGPGRPAPGPGRQDRAQASTLTESWPAAPSDTEDPQPDDEWPGNAWPGDSTATDSGLRAARPGADLDAPSLAGPGPGAPRDARSRRRVGFRKGADIDEELWPAESFGGVSDEQFWDDLASDKPLTTTARTAQQDAGPRSRLLDTGPDTDPQGTQALGDNRSGPGQARSDRARADRARADQGRADQGRSGRAAGEGRRSAGYGAYPGPRTGTDPAADRTVVQPAYAATQPVKSMAPPPAPAAPQPFPGATQSAASITPPGATQPVRAASGTGPSGTGPSGTGPSGTRPSGTGPSGTGGQPRGASAPPGETGRRRRPSGGEEDPLTSASFSLRQRGPVDGRSSLRSRDDQQDAPGERDASGPGRGPAGPYGHTAPYSPAPAGTSYDDASSVTQMMSTPPYGENYGSGNQADHARRRNGTRSHARPVGTGEQPRPPRPAYPQDVRQASGSYPAGAYPGNGHRGHGHQPGGYPGNGYPANGYPASDQPDGDRQGSGYPGNGSRGNGHRAPHDPRDDYRRLTHRRLPSRLGSCPKETWSGRPPAACTRRWRDGR